MSRLCHFESLASRVTTEIRGVGFHQDCIEKLAREKHVLQACLGTEGGDQMSTVFKWCMYRRVMSKWNEA